MRGSLRALSNYLHLMRSRQCSQAALDDLNKVPEEYLDCYAEAQMIISDEVFAAAADANSGLGRICGMALRLDGFTVPVLSSEPVSDANEKGQLKRPSRI
jgi:hypothetical protein